MSLIIPFFSLLISLLLGSIITKSLSLRLPKFSSIFFSSVLGIIVFTIINFFFSLFLGFSTGILTAQILIVFLITLSLYKTDFKKNFPQLINSLRSLFSEKLLVLALGGIGIVLFILFSTHIIPNKDGNLYTGESTYGDLPFHLSTISQISYGNHFPPENPFYSGVPLVYPYLINFLSAILVYEGMSLQNSIIIPGMILSLALIGVIYDFVLYLTRNRLISFLTIILYFFHGGAGFYYFLKDNSFNLMTILHSLASPQSIKEYSHLFDQNIQWANFLSRMIVPERSILFGISTGIIILRILYFREEITKIKIFDLIIVSILISYLPLLHTHTALVMVILLPILSLFLLKKSFWQKQLLNYFLVAFMTIVLLIPQIPLFLNHVQESSGFFKVHFWWLKSQDESPLVFWLKNLYLYLPFSLLILLNPKIGIFNIKLLQICGLVLFIIMNIFLFSPYAWDNVKFLFWAGLFFAIAAATILGDLLKKNFLVRTFAVFIMLTMVSTALLSLWREINVNYILFSKEDVEVAIKIKNTTPKDSIFLTFKIHNSPASNLAGRQILMGYPGSLWVHGINYSQRELDINKMYSGSDEADQLFKKYKVDYVVITSGDPEGLSINRSFFQKYPLFLETQNYKIYRTK